MRSLNCKAYLCLLEFPVNYKKKNNNRLNEQYLTEGMNSVGHRTCFFYVFIFRNEDVQHHK